MAKQRVVNTFFWNDDFILNLKADEKLLFLYILTNPQTDLCGAYQIAIKRMTFDTGLSAKRIEVILAKFEAAGKICFRGGWMVIKNFAKHQVSNPKVTQGIKRSLNGCPDWVKDMLSKGFDSLSPKTTPEPEPEPEPTEMNKSPREAVSKNRNQEIETQIGTWVKAVAVACGAKSVESLPKRNRWDEVVAIAVREDHDLGRMLSVIEGERKRLGADTQFFSPETCLQKLQMLGSKPREPSTPSIEEKFAEHELAIRNMKPPPTQG